MAVSESSPVDVTKTTTNSDSFNSNNTFNRVFDNAGNTNVYFNSPSDSGGGGAVSSIGGINMKYIAIILLLLGAWAYYSGNKKGN